MNTAIYILIFILVCFGLYQILSDVFEIPNFRKMRTILSVGKIKKEKSRFVDDLLFNLSRIIANYIHLNPYKHKKIAATLYSLGSNKTPEMLYAEGLSRGLVCLVGAVLFVFIFPLISFALVILAVLMYLREIQAPFNLMEERRRKIDRELPRLTATIEQELKNRHDVLGILIDYRKNSGKVLGEELDITIADMKSSNYENALTRLESRVGSGTLSNVTRGLIAVIRGDENQYYFNMLSMQLRDLEINQLKLEAMKRPGKLKKYIVLILVAFMGSFFVVVGYQVVTLLPTLF